MKLSDRFRIQLLKRSWKLGVGPFLKMVLSLLINSGPVINTLVYSRDCRDGLRVTMPPENSVVFQNFATWEEIPNDLKKSLVMADNRQEEGFENVIKRGWRLWIGTIGDQLAIFNWTRTSSHSADFFFPIGEKAVVIWHVETLPAYRGMGLMTLLMDHIAQTLDAEGIHTVYGLRATYNLATKHALEKTHFRVIGRGLMRAGSGRGMVWIPAKKVQESKGAA